MTETISAAEANRNFSAILRGVREGNTYLITSHGRTVARIEPAQEVDLDKEAKYQEFLDYLETRPTIDIGSWTRDELYEDEDDNQG